MWYFESAVGKSKSRTSSSATRSGAEPSRDTSYPCARSFLTWSARPETTTVSSSASSTLTPDAAIAVRIWGVLWWTWISYWRMSSAEGAAFGALPAAASVTVAETGAASARASSAARTAVRLPLRALVAAGA